MTLADIAGWLLLSWDTVKIVVQRRLEKDYQRIGYRKVHAIAIDELYLGRARKYITLVIDLESGRIIWVGQGRGSQALREFWRRYKLSGARLNRLFDAEDLARLRFILQQQRDHFLPLKVIKSKLTLWERGEETGSPQMQAEPSLDEEGAPLSRDDLLKRSGLEERQLGQPER